MAIRTEIPKPSEKMSPSQRGEISLRLSNRFAKTTRVVPINGRNFERFQYREPGKDFDTTAVIVDVNGVGYGLTVNVERPMMIPDVGKQPRPYANRRVTTFNLIKFDGPNSDMNKNPVSQLLVQTTHSLKARFGNQEPYVEVFGVADGLISNPTDTSRGITGTVEDFADLLQNEQLSAEAVGQITSDLHDDINESLRRTPKYVDALLSTAESHPTGYAAGRALRDITFVVDRQRFTITRVSEHKGMTRNRKERSVEEELYIIDVEDIDPNSPSAAPTNRTRIQISTTYSYIFQIESGNIKKSDIKHLDGSVMVIKNDEYYPLDDRDPESYREIRGMIPFLSKAPEADPFGYFYPQPPKK